MTLRVLLLLIGVMTGTYATSAAAGALHAGSGPRSSLPAIPARAYSSARSARSWRSWPDRRDEWRGRTARGSRRPFYSSSSGRTRACACCRGAAVPKVPPKGEEGSRRMEMAALTMFISLCGTDEEVLAAHKKLRQYVIDRCLEVGSRSIRIDNQEQTRVESKRRNTALRSLLGSSL